MGTQHCSNFRVGQNNGQAENLSFFCLLKIFCRSILFCSGMIRSLKILLSKKHGKIIELKESHPSNILIFYYDDVL